MTPRKKRWLVGCPAAIVVLALGLWGCAPLILDRIAGASRHAPEELERSASPAARALLDRAFAGLDARRLLDVHTHVAGLGTDGSGCAVNPEMLSWWHPWKRAQFLVYAHAARIEDLEHGDAQFVERLRALARGSRWTASSGGTEGQGRYGLLAFDRHYRPDGTQDDEHTEMYLPNDWIFAICAQDPDLFVPVCSVHPFRPDALAELERCAAKGARMCKWLPNAMGIDPSDARLDAFYRKLVETRIALLTHTGEELAVDAAGAQDLGNPLRVRRALEQGATVILAHCASLGEGVDLDDPSGKMVPNLELFLRMMDDPRWVGRLYGEISATTLANREKEVLETLLRRTDLHPRLLNGSDYPLPAIRVVWSARRFAKDGFLTEDEARALEEIYDYNPLLFDFVLKRTLKHPTTGARFADEVFLAREELGY